MKITIDIKNSKMSRDKAFQLSGLINSFLDFRDLRDQEVCQFCIINSSEFTDKSEEFVGKPKDFLGKIEELDAERYLEMSLGGNMNLSTLKPLAWHEIMESYAQYKLKLVSKASESPELTMTCQGCVADCSITLRGKTLVEENSEETGRVIYPACASNTFER